MKQAMTTIEQKREALEKVQRLVDGGATLTGAIKQCGYWVSGYYEWKKAVAASSKQASPVTTTVTQKKKYIKHAKQAVLLPIEPQTKNQVFVIYGSPVAVASTIERLM